MQELLTIKEASEWATDYLNKEVSTSNISYLVQYGRVSKFESNGSVQVAKEELVKYYKKNNSTKEERWKDNLGDDLNWALSFAEYKESETTKHVHRLHPYKGKFIPQLVEYFLDSHTDKFKKGVFFKRGDIVLDPFCGSGTTLVEASELGINAIGIDVSAFNTQISNSKVGKYNFQLIEDVAKDISLKLKKYLKDKNNTEFEIELLSELKDFNAKYFPSPDYRYKVRQKLIDEKSYSKEKESKFFPLYNKLVQKYNIELKQERNNTFLDKWFIKVVRDEIDFVFNEIKKIKDVSTKRILMIVLSRTVRSCRATTHSDLGTLLEPQLSTYYCRKHGKICKPLFSIDGWWNRYTNDTLKRLKDFDDLRTNTHQLCLTGDSRKIDIISKLERNSPDFAEKINTEKISGVFSSPPYVGLIDYHEQHAYAYDLFGFERNDELEIGPLYKGQGREAKESYAKGIAEVLLNSKRYLKEDYNVFLVANDKYGLYPLIAEKAGMKIINQYKRPVLNRVEKDRNAYSEIIFHLKEK